jgi:ABC-type sugar transport system ATPase subunit
MRYEVLRLEHIGRAVNNQIINDISLNLYAKEALCVLTEDMDTENFLLDFFRGAVPSDQGHLYVYDSPKCFFNLNQARGAGIFVVDGKQLIRSMDVAHNLFLTSNQFYEHFHFLDTKKLHSATEALLKKFSLEYIKSSALVRTLSLSETYILSILYAYTNKAKIIVLSPSASLFFQPSEIKKLQRIVNLLKEEQISILWFSNRWNPVFQNFDRYAVIKNGVVTQITKLTAIPPIIPETSFVNAALKRSFSENSSEKEILKGIRITAPHDSEKAVSFSLYQNEILGICDSNNILIPFINALSDGKLPKNGTLLLDGKKYIPNFTTRNQIAFISPANGQSRIFPKMNLYDNISLLLKSPMYNALGFLNSRIRNHMVCTALESIRADYLIKEYGTKRNLGNMNFHDQFMVEIAKWLCLKPKVFIFSDPYSIYDNLSEYHFIKLLESLRELNISLLLISNSEENLSKFCTRVINTESLPDLT